MAHHKSAKKRIRQTEVREARNKYKKVGMKLGVKAFRHTTDKEEAAKMLPEVFSKIDRAAKANIIHANKAANLKSSLARYMNKL